MLIRLLALLIFVVSSNVFAGHLIDLNTLPASFVTIKISAEDGKAREFSMTPAPVDGKSDRFGEIKVVYSSNKVLRTITAAMTQREANRWELLDGIISQEKFVPYYIPAISLFISEDRADPSGFVKPSGSGTGFSLPARIGSKETVQGLTIEVVKIEDGPVGYHFEASPAEAACFNMKYTHQCLDEFAAKQRSP